MKSHIIAFSLLLTLFLSPVSATSLRPISLEQLSTNATLIFYGKVLSNQVKPDAQSGYIATFTKFKVIDLIKGDAGARYTIKQIGGELKDRNMAFHVHGVPSFKTGNNYVVFLPERSSLGFSSPLGLHQGSFSVLTINGEQLVTHAGSQNNPAPIVQPGQTGKAVVPLAVRADNPSQSRLDDFINTVRAYNTQ